MVIWFLWFLDPGAAQRCNNEINQIKLVLCVHGHTLAAPLLAEEEAAAGPGAGGAEVLSKSSSAPERKG